MSLAKRILLAAALGAFCVIAGLAAAQDEQQVPKWELFGGYSWSDPNAVLHVPPPPSLTTGSFPLRSQVAGFGTSLTYNFNKVIGLTGDFSAHFGGNHPGIFQSGKDDSNMYTFSVGPKFTYRGEHFAPFIEALIGWNRLTPDGFDSDNRFGFLGGGGVDINVTKHWNVRLIQADYIYSTHRYAPTSLASSTVVNGARIQSGIVYLWGGGPPPPPPAASCSASPSSVMAGEPVKVTATPANFPAKGTIAYAWTSTGGKVSGTDATTTVDTAGLAPGSYTVTANATSGKKASATCNASFTVNEPPKNPPTVSCSGNPSSVKSGESSTITASCTSPDNRSVSISNWTASSGKIMGSGNTATLDTAGAAPGPIEVSATCSDDRGLTASCSATVTVEAPAAKPEARQICSFDFTNKAKPARVDNAAKACLDGAADSLLQDPNAKAVLVGEQGDKEKPKAPKLAAQRAVNTKAYLTSGENQKAIDGSRIEPRTGSGGGQKVNVWVVPEGATFDQTGTEAVDETKVKGQARVAAPAKKKAKKADAAAPTQ